MRIDILDIDTIYNKLKENPLIEFLENIREYIECEEDRHVLIHILSGAHVILLDNGTTYDHMKQHTHAKKRISSHYNNNLFNTDDDIQYEIVGILSNVYNECTQMIGSSRDYPQNIYNLLFGCIQIPKYERWHNANHISYTDRMTWFQFENSSPNQPISHIYDTAYYMVNLKRYNVGPCRHLSIYTDRNPMFLSKHVGWKSDKKSRKLSQLIR
tara:strand:+ start:179 stop:817 length:639 start_codon:yes stop_codon:yes gene_type:complete